MVSSVNLKAGDKLIIINNGEAIEFIGNSYGRESSIVLADIFKMDSLRNPIVQYHIDNIWACLKNKDYESEEFNMELSWLKDNVDSADSIFVQINMQIAMIKKGL